VDYERRIHLLSQLRARLAPGPEHLPALCRELTEHREDGRIKLYLLTRALHCRREHPGLFTRGEYLPAHADADRDDNIWAFVRRHNGQVALAAAPRLLTRMLEPGDLPLGEIAWEEARLFLPEGVSERSWHNVFTGQTMTTAEHEGRPCL